MCCVQWDVMPEHFFEKSQTVTEEVHRVFQIIWKSWMVTVVLGMPYVCQQCGHRLTRATWSKIGCPMTWTCFGPRSSSPRIARIWIPPDYHVRSVVGRVANKTSHPSVTSLLTAIEGAFTDSALLMRAYERLRPRMEAVIADDGRCIESFYSRDIPLFDCEEIFYFICILCQSICFKRESLVCPDLWAASCINTSPEMWIQ